MQRIAKWWRKIPDVKSIWIVLAALVIASVSAVWLSAGKVVPFALDSCRLLFLDGSEQELPFEQHGWLTDLPWGSRHAMAKYLDKNRTLIGMSDTDVRKLLRFGQFKGDDEAPGASNSTILIMTVTAWHCEYDAHFYVTIKDGKVIEASFLEAS